MVNSPLIRPYFLGGGGIGGVPLDSHDNIKITTNSLREVGEAWRNPHLTSNFPQDL